jgi:hypothetical protein
MKTLKIGSTLVVALLSINSFGQAEGRPEMRENAKQETMQKQTPEEKAKVQTDRLTKQLLLTDDQVAKIYETNLAVNMKNEAVHKNSSWNEDQKKVALDGNNAGRVTVIKSFLTQEQIAKYEEMETKKEERQDVKTNDASIKKGTKKANK